MSNPKIKAAQERRDAALDAIAAAADAFADAQPSDREALTEEFNMAEAKHTTATTVLAQTEARFAARGALPIALEAGSPHVSVPGKPDWPRPRKADRVRALYPRPQHGTEAA